MSYSLEKFQNVIFKIVDLIATWIIGIFGWNQAIFKKKHLSFEELLW